MSIPVPQFHYVVETRKCLRGIAFPLPCRTHPSRECDGCLGNGLRLDIGSRVLVERRTLCGEDHDANVTRLDDGRTFALPDLPCCWAPGVFIPVESSSSGEGGDQWPEATGASAAEREEVAAHEVDASLVAEAPEGTQPPGLSDGDER